MVESLFGTRAKKILWLILLGAFIIRAYGLTLPILESAGTRQEMTASVARNYFQTGTPFLKPLIDFPGPRGLFYLEMPFYPYAVGKVYSLMGYVSEAAARLVNVLLGLVLVLLVYLLAQAAWQDVRKSLWAAAVAAFSPIMITYTRTVQPDPLMFVLTTAAVYAAYLWFKHDRLRDALAMTICFSLALLSKPQSFFVIFPIAYVFWHKYRRTFWRQPLVWIFAAVVGLPFGFWFMFICKMHALYPSSDWGGASEADQILQYRYLLTWDYWRHFGEFIAGKGLTPIGLFFFAKALWQKPRVERFFYAWLGGVLVYMFVFALHTASHKYYYVPLITCMALFIGYALGQDHLGFKKSLARGWKMFCGVVAVLGVILSLPSTYKLSRSYAYVVESSHALRDLSAPDDLVVAVRRIYYTERAGWELPFSGELSDEDILGHLRSYREQGAKWLLISYAPDIARRPELADILDKNFKVAVKNDKYWIYQLS